MLGSYADPGIMPRSLTYLFEQIERVRSAAREIFVKCSFLEVYNENIRDLLNPENISLELREDPIKGMTVSGIFEVSGLSSAQELLDLLHKGNTNRTTEPTSANVTSSRSHAVLTVVVETKEKTDVETYSRI